VSVIFSSVKNLLTLVQARNRPLVFIGHSLGGIIIKKVGLKSWDNASKVDKNQALIIAYEAKDFYEDILNSTKGIVFMGTPHPGSELVPWSLMFTNLINIAGFGQVIRKDLLKNLDKDCAILDEISRQFMHRATPLKIRSFIEQKIERPLTTLVCKLSNFDDHL
jgi:hypothetical protein